MKRYLSVVVVIAALFALSSASIAENLLRNPGFEDAVGWSQGWRIVDAAGGDLTYHYRLSAQGGGHGDAKPRTGANALEIYSCDRQTYLAQIVDLQPGKYRMSAWARLNGTPDFSTIELKLGDKKVVCPLATDRYKQIWGTFAIDAAGSYTASFHSSSYGVAFDDLSLEKMTDGASALPAMNIDLFPSGHDRSNGIQNCLKGTPQWVNFVVTCLDPARSSRPVMRVLVSKPARLSGLNESLIHHYRMRNDEQVTVKTETVVRNGQSYTQSSFPLPQFVTGYDKPLSFGGCWVSDVPAKGGQLIMEIIDSEKGDALLSRETVRLVSVDPPKAYRTPKKYYTLAYAVQNWQMALEERVQALPRQFMMMGLNVWSDYGLSAEKPKPGMTNEEIVLHAAYRQGVRWFWPNFSSFLETSGGGVYSDSTTTATDKDMYLVNREGKTVPTLFNPNYAANGGSVWMKSAVDCWTRTQRRAIEKGFPFRYTGFVNDGLEGVPISFDPSTLAAFAAFKGVRTEDVTLDKLAGEWKRDWTLFNMNLSAKLMDVWSGELKRNDPSAKIVNTADSFGPSGFSALTLRERMEWARSVDYNMPQWYASSYYGAAYSDLLKQGDEAKVFGKHNGGTDVIPLLYLSMGGLLEDPDALRFKILDMISGSKSVKGIGYYIGTYGFVDAKFMVGMSRVHTLLADIEDYYADGSRDDSLVSASSAGHAPNQIVGMDMQGKQAMVTPMATSSVRVHKLGIGKRVALITVITNCEQTVGQKLNLTINRDRLPRKGRGLVLIDHLTGRRVPLPDKFVVDTNKSKNVAVLEIAEK